MGKPGTPGGIGSAFFFPAGTHGVFTAGRAKGNQPGKPEGYFEGLDFS